MTEQGSDTGDTKVHCKGSTKMYLIIAITKVNANS